MFVDSLKELRPDDQERIERTCSRFVEGLHRNIRRLSEEAARRGENSISGYACHGSQFVLKEVAKEDLVDQTHFEAPFAVPNDYSWVFTDKECTCVNAYDPVRLDRSTVEDLVLDPLKARLIEDGFVRCSLRCDDLQEYYYETKYGIFKDRRVKKYTGKTLLFIYISVSW